LALMAAFGLAVTLIATKKLTRTDSTFAILFWMMLIQLPIALAASEPLFVTKLNQTQIPALIGIGVSGLASHYCLTNAFRAGDAGVVVPLDFMRIPLIAVIGWWLYGESLDVFVFLGAGLIVTGILWNLRSEARRATKFFVPIRSISTSVSGTSSPVQPMVVRGGGCLELRFHTVSKPWELFRSVRNNFALTAISREGTAGSKGFFKLMRTDAV